MDYVQLLMIGRAGQWTQTPYATPLQPEKWNACFWIMFNFWWLAGLVDGLEPHPPPLSSQNKEMLIFGLLSTSDDWQGWLMDLNTICHPSPAKIMKCSFLDYIQLLLISQAGQWTRTPSTNPLQQKKWNAHFWSMFNFWWSAGLVDGLEPHPPPLSSTKKTKFLLLDYVQLLMIGRAGQWTWTPSTTPLQPKKWNAHFWITFNFWWLAGLVNGLKPHPPHLSSQKNEMLIFGLHSTSMLASLVDGLEPHSPPLSSQKNEMLILDYVQLLMIGKAGWWTWTPSATSLQPKKNEMLIFGLCSTSDDQPGWLMDLNPICHPSPAKIMKCSFLDYIQLLLISQAGQWTRTPSTTPLQQKKWNAHFWSMFNFWWSPGLVDGLEPHLLPLSSHKIRMLIFGLHSLLMISWAGWWTQTPSTTPLQPEIWNACSWIMFNSDDRPGWFMDLNPIRHPSPAKKWNAHFWSMFNFWWSAGLVDGLKPHPPPLSSQKIEMLIFGLRSTSNNQPGWSMDSNPIHHTSLAKKMKWSFLDYVQLLMISQVGRWTRTPSATSLQPKKWNAHFWLCWTSDNQPGCSMDLNPICYPSPATKLECSYLDYIHFWWSAGLVDGLEPHTLPSPARNMKCLFLDYVQLWWSARLVHGLEPNQPPLSSQKRNAHFWSMFNFWWLARLVDGLEPHPPPLSSHNNDMLIFGLCSTSVDRPGWSMNTNPMHHPSPAKKWNAHFWITFNFWWLARLVDGLEHHLPPFSSQKNEMLIFGLCSTSDDQPGWSMDSNPMHHPSPAKIMKCSFLDYVQLLMISWLVNGLKPHPPPLSSQKNKILAFGLCSTSDDWPGWLMDSNPQPPPLSSTKKWNAHFWIMFNFW